MTALQAIELELPPLPASIGRARDALSSLEDVSPEVHQSAMLVTSELVTNGIRHGSDDPGAVLTFRAQRFDRTLMLEVRTTPPPASGRWYRPATRCGRTGAAWTSSHCSPTGGARTRGSRPACGASSRCESARQPAERLER
jgi:hypothetical protein